jgi:hypothetical protein
MFKSYSVRVSSSDLCESSVVAEAGANAEAIKTVTQYVKEHACKNLLENTKIIVEFNTGESYCFDTTFILHHWFALEINYDFAPFWSIPTKAGDIFLPDDAPIYKFIYQYCQARSLELLMSSVLAREILLYKYPEQYHFIWKLYTQDDDVQDYRRFVRNEKLYNKQNLVTKVDVNILSVGEYVYDIIRSEFRFPKIQTYPSHFSQNVLRQCTDISTLFNSLNVAFLDVVIIMKDEWVLNEETAPLVQTRAQINEEIKVEAAEYWVVLYGIMDTPFQGHANSFLYSKKHRRFAFFEPLGMTNQRARKRLAYLKDLVKYLKYHDNNYYAYLAEDLDAAAQNASTLGSDDITNLERHIRDDISAHFDNLINQDDINLGLQYEPRDNYCVTYSLLFLLHFISLLEPPSVWLYTYTNTNDDTWENAVKDFHIFILYIRMTGLVSWVIHNMQLEFAQLLNKFDETMLDADM